MAITIVSKRFQRVRFAMDSRDAQIRSAVAQGEMELTLDPFTIDLAKYADLQTLTAKPNAGINACAEQYYGVKSIIVPEEEQDKSEEKA